MAQDRKAKREATRQARIEAQRRRRRARRRKKVMVWSLVLVVVLGGVAFGVQRSVSKRREVAQAATEAGCTPVREIESLGTQHVQPDQAPDKYNSTPATSGPHGPLASWGSLSETLPPYQYVHNLEHGGVVIQYKDLSDDEIDELDTLVGSYREGVVAMPNEEIDSALAMGAWTRLQTCERYATAAVRAFISARCGKGPEKIVACS